MTEEDYPELTARDIFFRKLVVSTRDMQAIMSHPRLYVFLALVICVFVAFDAIYLRSRMEIWQVILTWTVSISLHILLFHIFLSIWTYGQRRFSLPVLYLPVSNLTAFSVSYFITVFQIGLHTDRLFSEVSVPGFIFSGIVFCLIFEAVYFAFVDPLIRGSITARRTNSKSSAVQTRSISVAGEQFLVDSILTLRGQEHYVLITTEEGEHLLRARLGDLVSQTREDDGVLAHRSYWVGRQAIARLEVMSGSDVILTHSGEQLPVARPRKNEVRGWMAQHAPHAISPDGRSKTG